jgi:hypothetical protein
MSGEAFCMSGSIITRICWTVGIDTILHTRLRSDRICYALYEITELLLFAFFSGGGDIFKAAAKYTLMCKPTYSTNTTNVSVFRYSASEIYNTANINSNANINDHRCMHCTVVCGLWTFKNTLRWIPQMNRGLTVGPRQPWRILGNVCARQEKQVHGSFTRSTGTLTSNIIRQQTNSINLIIGLCILLRVYQLNIGITSVRNKVFFVVVDFIVHFSHYRFRPRLAAIFWWFANIYIYIYIYIYSDYIRYFLCLRTTWRWPPNGTETCSVRVHNKI